MKEKILQYLAEEMPEIDFTSSNELVDDGILDSLALTQLMALLSMEFGVEIPYEEITTENFNSIEGIAAMVERLQKA